MAFPKSLLPKAIALKPTYDMPHKFCSTPHGGLEDPHSVPSAHPLALLSLPPFTILENLTSIPLSLFSTHSLPVSSTGHFSSWNLLPLQLLPPCYEGLNLLSVRHRKSFLI